MYGAVDPIYMVMLIKNLGNGYYAVDKSASISYLKKAKSTLTAKFHLSDSELDEIKTQLFKKQALIEYTKLNL